jgi:hypothetical protein
MRYSKQTPHSPVTNSALKYPIVHFRHTIPHIRRRFNTPLVYVESPYERRWGQFRRLRLFGDEAIICPHPDLLAHAKLYVFATRYRINPLREQCLKSLHCDLCNFSLNGQSMAHILDLLEYTYEQTDRQEPDGCYWLRMLVILYVLCKVRTLVENTRFRHILDDNGEMASDLVTRLVE